MPQRVSVACQPRIGFISDHALRAIHTLVGGARVGCRGTSAGCMQGPDGRRRPGSCCGPAAADLLFDSERAAANGVGAIRHPRSLTCGPLDVRRGMDASRLLPGTATVC